MNVGYIRVSTQDQTLALQRDALAKINCDRVFDDVASGAKADRPGMAAALAFVRPGDVLVVWRLDRLGRSMRHLVDTVMGLEARGVGFLSLTEKIDTTSSSGRLMFHIFASLAEFERDLIRERVQAGLNAARARGRKGGRQPVKALNTPQKIAVAQRLYDDPTLSVIQVCRTLGVSRATLYKYITIRSKGKEGA